MDSVGMDNSTENVLTSVSTTVDNINNNLPNTFKNFDEVICGEPAIEVEVCTTVDSGYSSIDRGYEGDYENSDIDMDDDLDEEMLLSDEEGTISADEAQFDDLDLDMSEGELFQQYSDNSCDTVFIPAIEMFGDFAQKGDFIPDTNNFVNRFFNVIQ